MFIRDEYGNLTFVPASLCNVEGEGGEEGAGGAGGEQGGQKGGEGASGQEGAKGSTGEGEGAKASAAADDWRAGLTTDDAKKYAERFTDVGQLVNGALEMRKQLSTAIVPPGKDAKPEEVAAYHKRIGVPETAEGYKFPVPEGHEPTETDKAFQAAMGKALHRAAIPAAAAAQLTDAFNEFSKGVLEQQVAEDKKFSDESEAELRKAWRGAEYDANKAHAERAAAWMFGDQVEEVRHLETKDGRFMMDNPVMLRALAAVGREMAEGGLVPPMAAGAKDQAIDELNDLQKSIDEAQGRGDSREANRLYAKKLALREKIDGSQPIVGSAARAA